jgi:hypothetical protein
MPYTISAIVTPRRVRVASQHRDTAMDAIECARELMRIGMVGVEIRDPQGRIYGPDDFARLQVETKDQKADGT